MLASKHFTSEPELLEWVNAGNVRVGDIIDIIKTVALKKLSNSQEVSLEDWILFYAE